MKAIAIALVLLSAVSASASEAEFDGAVCEAIGIPAYSQEIAIQDEEILQAPSVEVASAASATMQ